MAHSGLFESLQFRQDAFCDFHAAILFHNAFVAKDIRQRTPFMVGACDMRIQNGFLQFRA